MSLNEPITRLSVDVVRRMLSKNNKDATNGVLDMSRSNHFELRSYTENGELKSPLGGLGYVKNCGDEKEYFTKRVKKVVLSGNNLSGKGDSLYELRVFRKSVEQVVAVNCQLVALGWKPDKEFVMLQELNLQHNFLTGIPDLTCCPRLRRLNLANNDISGLANLKRCPPSLEFLDLSHNHIRYPNIKYLKIDMANFQRFSNMNELRLESNDFTIDFRDKYRQVILNAIAKGGAGIKLRYLDGPVTEDMITFANKFGASEDDANEEEEEKSAEPLQTVMRTSAVERSMKQFEFLPTTTHKSRFAKIDHLLDECLVGNAASAITQMEELQSEAKAIIKIRTQGGSLGDSLFTVNEANVPLKINEFLQKCVALSERRKEMIAPLLHVLATLARCSAGGEENSDEKKFGIACLRQLQDFMSANEETRALVIKVIDEELFSTPFSNLENARSTFIPELCEMAEKADCPQLLGGILKYLLNRLAQVAQTVGERSLILRTLAVASRDDRDGGACFRLGEEALGDQLLQELLENNPDHQVRVSVLETIKNLCHPNVRHGRKADSKEFADYLASTKGFHRTLLLDLSDNAKVNLQTARAPGALATTDLQKPEELIAIEIDCLTAMLKNSRKAFADLCGAKDPQLFHLLARYFLPKVPHLLAEAATYRCVCALLQTTFCPISIREDAPVRFKRDIFEDLQRIVLSTNVGNLLDYLREDSVQYADAWKVATRKVEGAPDFKNLREEKLHRLFIAIIDLIAAFNIQATKEGDGSKKDGSEKIAAAIAETMNARGRESRLFACLEIPSDVVKLAAVKCLDTVKLSEFDESEVHRLVQMLKDVMNVSAGKTEEVIAISLDILTKHCVDASGKSASVFQRKFGEEAADACLRILEMNVTRDTRGMVAESEEKGVLTNACIRFLQATSKVENTAKYLTTEPIAAKADRILIVEDGFAEKVRFLASRGALNGIATGSAAAGTSGLSMGGSSQSHDPVLIEVTAAGSHVEHLMKVFMDVSPTGPVAPRLLRRIANIMMSAPESIDLLRKSASSSALAKDALADVRNAVRLDAAREREMSEFWYRNRATTHNEKVQVERERQHEEFMNALCLKQLFLKLDRVLQASTPTEFFRSSSSSASGVYASHLRNSKSSSSSSASTPASLALPELLQRHLMSERERFETRNQLELGGGLRTVPIELSPAEEYEAQKDFLTSVASLAGDDESNEREMDDTITAAIRVIFAALRFGTVETMSSAQLILREVSKFSSLVSIFFGSRDNPVFARSQLGSKFFLVAEAILEMPPLRRLESEAEIRPLQGMMFACADKALGLLRKRLLVHSRLAPGDENLVAAAMSCCATAALQLEYVIGSDGEEMAPEELFKELVPSSLLASALKLLLYDMTLTTRSSRKSNMHNKNVFGELPEDDARENTIRFLSFCLRHSPAHRYSILEYLIRSNITDQFPVRRMLIQELMKRTHKIGSTQRAALEFRIYHEEQEDDDDGENGQKPNFLVTTTAAVSAKNQLMKKVAVKKGTTAETSATKNAETNSAGANGAAPSWNPFGWCTGENRMSEKTAKLLGDDDTMKSTDDESAAQSDFIDYGSESGDSEALVAKSSPAAAPKQKRKTQLDSKWDAVDIPPPAPQYADRKHLSSWQADRLGERERIVAYSFVRWFESSRPSVSPENDTYNHVLVLTSEKYWLFEVEKDGDAEFPKLWKFVWKRPYRAVTRVCIGPARVHFVHKSSDKDTQPSTATALTPSRSSAKEIAMGFVRLSNAWRSVERALNPGLFCPPVYCIENGVSDSFRKSNFYIPFEGLHKGPSDRRSGGQRESHNGFYCEPVHVCNKKNKDGWFRVLAVLQNDVLYFVDKDWSQMTFKSIQDNNDLVTLPVREGLKFDLNSNIIKYDLVELDFDSKAPIERCSSLISPFPALVLKVGEQEIAIAFVDDLSRTVWKRMLIDRFMKHAI